MACREHQQHAPLCAAVNATLTQCQSKVHLTTRPNVISTSYLFAKENISYCIVRVFSNPFRLFNFRK